MTFWLTGVALLFLVIGFVASNHAEKRFKIMDLGGYVFLQSYLLMWLAFLLGLILADSIRS